MNNWQSRNLNVGKSSVRRPVRPRIESLEDRFLLAADFDYKMADRFGLDLNHNGLIDLPNTAQYAQATTFSLTLSVNNDPTPDSTVLYTWVLNPPGSGPNIKVQRLASDMATNPPVLNLPQGVYQTTFRRYDMGKLTTQTSHPVSVRDILIVSMGDSYASGEANPEKVQGLEYEFGGSTAPLYTDDLSTYSSTTFLSDVASLSINSPTTPALWADAATGFYGPGPYDGVAGKEGMQAENADAHRSTATGTAQYALQLERSDPHTSVTYVLVAQSGATILSAMGLETLWGKVNPNYPMPNEVDELHRIIGNRKVDQLFISLGGNDVEFANIATTLVEDSLIDSSDPIFANDPIGNLTDSTKISQTLAQAQALAGQSSVVASALHEFNTGALVLANRYALLRSMLSSYGVQATGTFITEYPDPTRVMKTMTNSSTGMSVSVPWWGTALDDVVPEAGATATVSYVVGQLIVQPLDQAVAAAATANGWNYISGISNAFIGHGYAAPKDGTADTTRFIRTARESVIFQGPFAGTFGAESTAFTSGTLHPNALGHQAIAAQIYATLAPTAVVAITKRAGNVVVGANADDRKALRNQGLTFHWQFGHVPGSSPFLENVKGQKVKVPAKMRGKTATLRVTNRFGLSTEVAVNV